MLTYKAQTVVQVTAVSSKPYSFPDESGKIRTGTSIFSTATVIGVNGQVAVIKIKGKSEEEVRAKLTKIIPGKPAEIEIRGDQKNGVLMLSA